MKIVKIQEVYDRIHISKIIKQNNPAK